MALHRWLDTFLDAKYWVKWRDDQRVPGFYHLMSPRVQGGLL